MLCASADSTFFITKMCLEEEGHGLGVYDGLKDTKVRIVKI